MLSYEITKEEIDRRNKLADKMNQESELASTKERERDSNSQINIKNNDDVIKELSQFITHWNSLIDSLESHQYEIAVELINKDGKHSDGYIMPKILLFAVKKIIYKKGC